MENLKRYKVQELTIQEMRTTDGGLIVALAICLFALGMAIGLGIISGKPK